MRTLIAIPCLDMVHTLFFASMLSLRKPEGTEVAIASCSLVYESRHTLALKAINEGFDRVLWLDSDMTFDPDMLERFSADLDQGLDFVCGLFFTRKNPIKPCVYEVCRPRKKKTGEIKNLELVQELYALYLEKPDVVLEWTRGHIGTDGNEDADKWANKAREGATI